MFLSYKTNYLNEKVNGNEPFLSMEQNSLKNVNNCLKTNIYSYLETSGNESSNLYLNVVHFFYTSFKLDICGSLRQLFSYIGVYYMMFY